LILISIIATMPLRADAPEFVPASLQSKKPARGDVLIQQLADAMGDESPPVERQHVLPASGVFCPYCRAGTGCAFHKQADASRSQMPVRAMPESHCRSLQEELLSTDGTRPSEASTEFSHAECIAVSCLLDADDCWDCDDASTDMDGSEAICAPSEAGSDSSRSLFSHIQTRSSETSLSSQRDAGTVPVNTVSRELRRSFAQVVANTTRVGRFRPSLQHNSGTAPANTVDHELRRSFAQVVASVARVGRCRPRAR